MRIAVIGTGRMGAYRADWLRRHPDVDEVLVGSVRADTVRAVLDAGPDAVVVSSATPDHAEHIALCAERGRPMLCEKPIALTLAESSAAIRRGGPLLQVSFQRRFDPGFAEARRLVAEGALGPLYCIRMNSFDHEPSPEHFIPTSGGMFRDLHIHDFDLVRWLTGLEVETVYATGAVRRWQRFARHGDVDTSATVLTMTGGLPVLSTGTRHNSRGYDVRAELLGSDDSIAVGLDRRTPVRSVEEDPPQLGGAPYTTFLDRFERAFRRGDARLARLRARPAREPLPGSGGVPRPEGRHRMEPVAGRAARRCGERDLGRGIARNPASPSMVDEQG
jgi:myo-inositol 2-dehydrogenase/D-chiro-inositol 1-dehydrogenase